MRRERRTRVAQDLRRRPGLDDASGLEDRDAVAQQQGVEEVVVNAEVVEGRAQPLVIYAEKRGQAG